MTERAVKKWQAKHGVVSSGTPDTTGFGAVGPKTREAVRVGCGSVPPPPIIECPIFTSPAESCPAGTIAQNNYDPNGCILPRDCVQTGTNLPPTISDVSGPTTLNAGQTGTWTVSANDPENGTLSYGVEWGDGSGNGTGASNASVASTAPQTATFTHSYAQAGTYTPVFTVTRPNTIVCIKTPCPSNGGSAKTSISVNVGSEMTVVDLSLETIYSTNTNNSSAFVSGTIVGHVDNKKVDYWKASISCTSEAVVLGKNNENICGIESVLYGRNYFDVTSDLLIWTVGAENNSTTKSSSVIFTLAAYDASGNKLGGDKEDVVLKPKPSSEPSITVLTPNGGETFKVGDLMPISWNMPTDQRYQVDWYLMPYNTPVDTSSSYIKEVGGYSLGGSSLVNLVSNGSSQATVPGVVSGQYKLRAYLSKYYADKVTLPSQALAYDESNTAFNIVAQPILSCSSLSTSQNSYFDICKSSGFDSTCFDKNTGGFQGCTNGSKSCTTNNTNAADNISCPINPTTNPSITVITPNGGEVWNIGEINTIEWSTSDDGGSDAKVSIQLFRVFEVDSGGYDRDDEYISTVAFVSDTGSYIWTIPDGLSEGNLYKIKIIKTLENPTVSLSDFSDTSFSIKVPVEDVPLSVDLKINNSDTPNAVGQDSPFTVTWASTGAVHCNASGFYIPLVDGGLWTDLKSTLTTGEKKLYARHDTLGYTSPLTITIQCFDSSNKQVTDTISVDVTPSLVPTNLSSVCAPDGKTATISWSQVVGADRYALRVDDKSNLWTGTCSTTNDGDICEDSNIVTSRTFTTTPGNTYLWWVHALKGNEWSANSHQTFTCPSSQVSQMQVDQLANVFNVSESVIREIFKAFGL